MNRTLCIGALAVLLFALCGCEREPDLPLNNPRDPEADTYVGHEVLDPADPINVPTVQITSAPATIKINVAYTFVATASDPNPKMMPEDQPGAIARYDWDFGDGTTKPNGAASEQHTFRTAGTRTVTVKVTDDDGNEKTHNRQVTVTPGQMPVAIPGGPYASSINDTIALVGTGTDADGHIAKFEWDFDGNGTYDWTSATTGLVRRPYPAPGTFRARLRVTDDDGNTDTTSARTAITNIAPVAATGGPYTIKINAAIALNGSGTDADGRVVKYEWDFDGNGTWDWESATMGQVAKIYGTVGTYSAKLRVTDEDGNTNWKGVQVTVTTGALPVAVAGGSYTIKINSPLTLNGSGTDADGQVVKYEWDFDGDGTYDWNSTTTGQVVKIFGVVGTYSVKLRVTDEDGNATDKTVQVTVTTGAFPVAVAGGPYTVKFNVSLTLNGSGTDADGQVVRYEWDFDGNGTYDWESTTTGQVAKVYGTAGTYTAKHRVTDDDGNAVEKTVQVTVTNYSPVANAGGPYTIKINSPLTLNGSGTDADGQVTKYEWDFDGDGTYDWSSTTLGQTTTIYGAVGPYSATLRVTDDDGNTTMNTIVVSVFSTNLPIAALIRTLLGHTHYIRSVAISPDGTTIVSGSYAPDKTIKLWNLTDGMLLRTLTGHTNSVGCVAVGPDGMTIVSGSFDSTINVWSRADGTLLRTLARHSGGVSCLAISPDGTTIVSGSYAYDNTIKVWNLTNGMLLRTLTGHTHSLESVAISPDGKTIVSGGQDNVIKVWNLADGALLRTLNGNADWVLSVAISPDGKTIVSGHSDNTIKVWNLSDGALLRTLTGHTAALRSVAISPDGTMIVSGACDNTVKIWNLSDGTLLGTLTGHTNFVRSVAISSDGTTIVSGSWDNTIKVWQASD